MNPPPRRRTFQSAIKRDPRDGEAHLGLAYSQLDLHKPQAALKEADLAEETMGDMRDVHVIRATAYGRQDMLGKAADGISCRAPLHPRRRRPPFGPGQRLVL